MLTRTYPPRIGGPGSLVHRLSRALTDKGFEVTVITQRIRGALNYEIDEGVKVHRTFCLSDTNEFTALNLSTGILAFTKKILEYRNNDIFHAHDISVAGFSGSLAKKFIGKPFLLKYGGDLVFEYLSIKRPRGWNSKKGLEGTLEYNHGYTFILHRIQDWYFRNYDLILPDSKYGRDFLLNRGIPKEKLKILPNGVDTNLFRPGDKNKLKEKLGFDGKIVFTATRLIELKGIDVLIDAMKKVSDKTNAKLIIAGTGPEMEYLKTRAKDQGNNVHFVGNISRDRMPDYIGMCDVYAIPSYHETTPNALLEAMACEKPIVVSDVPGMREVINDKCALKARVGDVCDLADKLILLLENEDIRRKLSKKAREKIEREYTWEKVIKSYIQLYESLY